MYITSLLLRERLQRSAAQATRAPGVAPATGLPLAKQFPASVARTTRNQTCNRRISNETLLRQDRPPVVARRFRSFGRCRTGQRALSSLSIIFRRCENARLKIFANAPHCTSVSNGVVRRTKTTHAESTSGCGKKQLAGILNQSRGS
mgnify:CR=1 FL=1